MSENKKGRLWWIVWKSGYKNQATVLEEKPKTYNDSLAHVIEHSSYQKAVDALRKIASEDFRGNRPQSSVDAYNALKELGEI